MGKKTKKSENNSDNKDLNQEVNENKIDFYNSFSPESDKNIPFPAPYKSEPRIFIEKEVFEEIQSHAKETTSVELCGVLIGEVRFDISGNYLYICGSIRGEKAKNSGVNVSFTPETWDYIHEVKDSKYPDYSIIGWYHTHPGFGIFLSDMDKFIQDYFFNQPYQVALVVDPIASLNGIFTWQEGKICPLKNCWVGKEVLPLTIGTVGGEETYNEKQANNIPTPSITPINEPDKNSSQEESFYKHAFFYFLCFNLAFLLANFIYMKFASNAGITAARAEAKDIIITWALDETLSNQLDAIKNHISQNANALPATYTIDANSFKQYSLYLNSLLDKVSDSSKTRRDSAMETLKKLAYRNLTVNETTELQSENIKQMLTDSILIQLEPYLTSLSAQPINENRIKEAKNMLDNILSICGDQQKKLIREKYPWIFQE